jgi:hypothetical protein
MEAEYQDDANDSIEVQQHQAPSNRASRPPPIALTSEVNLMQLQRQLKGLLRGNFELPHFIFYLNSQKSIRAVIRQLPISAPAEDKSDRLVNLGFDVISVKEIPTTRRSPAEGTITVSIPLFIITLARTSKSREMFKLTSLCHIAISVEVYKS